MNKTQKIIGVVVIATVCASIGLLVYSIRVKSEFGELPPISSGECDQSATTTDCSKIVETPLPPVAIATTSANPIQMGGETKTYESLNLGISLDYPVSLFIVEGVRGEGTFSITSIPPSDSRHQSDFAMGDLFLSIIKGKTVEEVAKTLAQGTLSSEEISLGGHRAKVLFSAPDAFAGTTWISILVETKRGTLKIQYAKDSLYEKVYSSIIETINFR